uniref:Uncharacterized protein n=1 Tax=Heterorhabditis bacteriophora TaxID=37862 RepID=A0A1I7W902_HETBA
MCLYIKNYCVFEIWLRGENGSTTSLSPGRFHCLFMKNSEVLPKCGGRSQKVRLNILIVEFCFIYYENKLILFCFDSYIFFNFIYIQSCFIFFKLNVNILFWRSLYFSMVEILKQLFVINKYFSKCTKNTLFLVFPNFNKNKTGDVNTYHSVILTVHMRNSEFIDDVERFQHTHYCQPKSATRVLICRKVVEEVSYPTRTPFLVEILKFCVYIFSIFSCLYVFIS